jgi:hypothetical protein
MNYARSGLPRNAGVLAHAKRVAAEAAAAEAAVQAAAVVELKIEDIPFAAPRGTPTYIDPPQEGEDAGYTPEVVEEEAPVRTSPLAPPPRPEPTFMGDLPSTQPAKRSSPPPVRPAAREGGLAPVRRPGFLPRTAATPPTPVAPVVAEPAADVKPRGGFAALPRKAATPVAPPEPEKEEWDPRFKNGKSLELDDIPF